MKNCLKYKKGDPRQYSKYVHGYYFPWLINQRKLNKVFGKAHTDDEDSCLESGESDDFSHVFREKWLYMNNEEYHYRGSLTNDYNDAACGYGEAEHEEGEAMNYSGWFLRD